MIAVDMVGYKTNTPKQAYLVNTEAEEFALIRTKDSVVVYEGFMGIKKRPDVATGDSVTIIDFSDFNEPGEYQIRTNGSTKLNSRPFFIGSEVYNTALNTIIESFYYHRCGTVVNTSSPWGHKICHLDDAPFYKNNNMYADLTGGWHDAGDYNKFSVNTALTAGLLLYSYEENPNYFKDNQLDIPESGNGIPDILDEVHWGLQWLLKMQRPDGGVYHKVSQEKWIGEFLPDQDPSERYLFGISSAATASFAATAALGSRLLKEFDPIFSSQLSKASIKAWKFLNENPANIPLGGFKNPAGVTGGEYGDPIELDERLWASIELYKLTGDSQYLIYFIQNYRRLNITSIPPLSWRDAHMLALQAFLSADTKGMYVLNKEEIKTMVVQQGDALLSTQKNNNYQNLLRQSQYYWGSNSVALAYAFNLIHAYKITKNVKYSQAALDQLHYIFGRNPFALSQVTGVGSASVLHPYHQFSELNLFSTPVPGMLVGGPNNFTSLKGTPISEYPGKNYEDKFANYLVNEPAINYTAILAYVTTFFCFPSDSLTAISRSKEILKGIK